MSDVHADEKRINEEYKIWKKNTPFLYDVVVSHALEWPSLTVQWLPKKHELADKGHVEYGLLLGTHTSDSEQNYLLSANVQLPDMSGNASGSARVWISQRVAHEGEVNRARYMPQRPSIVATKSPSSSVFVFNLDNHPPNPEPDAQPAPDLVLKGHDKEGYGLAWNPKREGQLLSGSDDNLVVLWDDIANAKRGDKQLSGTRFTAHTDVVEDVAWSLHLDSVFASVGDDARLMIWDTRHESRETPRHCVAAHKADINSVAFSPHSEFLVVTGSADQTLALWDMRKLSHRLHVLDAHEDEVFSVQFSSTHPTVLASSSGDRKVNVWDLARIGAEQDPVDAEDGPPELLFVHSGHTARVSDMAWNPHEPMMLASSAEDNVVQIWQMAENIYREEEMEVDPGQLE